MGADFLTTGEAAALVGLMARSLARYRQEGTGLPCYKFGEDGALPTRRCAGIGCEQDKVPRVAVSDARGVITDAWMDVGTIRQ